VPEDYQLGSPQPSISGHAWCGAGGSERWRFTLLLDPCVRTREEIDWAALLPGDRLTGWLSPDPERRTMTIDPLGGRPD
jgi:hypothetical protein